ncbi:MAG: hypothetical protein A4E43_01543 [Methanosaeta sp. PtaB.Bin005]|nr:MAG: hypothetical protein A4E43_01543 [Methanosaeta sp. PtaB.Bin005]
MWNPTFSPASRRLALARAASSTVCPRFILTSRSSSRLCTPSSTLVAPSRSISSISRGRHQSGLVSKVVPMFLTRADSFALATDSKDCQPELSRPSGKSFMA